MQEQKSGNSENGFPRQGQLYQIRAFPRSMVWNIRSGHSRGVWYGNQLYPEPFPISHRNLEKPFRKVWKKTLEKTRAPWGLGPVYGVGCRGHKHRRDTGRVWNIRSGHSRGEWYGNQLYPEPFPYPPVSPRGTCPKKLKKSKI